MKVAFVNQPFDEVYGNQRNSIGLWSYRAAIELSKRHQVTIFCRNFEGGPVAESENIRYSGHSIEADDKAQRYRRFLKLWYRGKRPLFATRWFYPGYYKSIASKISQEKFDVIHLHNFANAVDVIRELNPKARIVLHYHCDWLQQLPNSWLRRSIAQVDLVLGCSDFIVNRGKKRFPEFADKMHTLYNGFDPALFFVEPKLPSPFNDEKPRLLYVGRGSPEKGLHLLARAFSILVKEIPDLQLVAIGGIASAPKAFIVDLVEDEIKRDLEGCYPRPYDQQVYEELTTEARSRFQHIGFVPYEELVAYYQHATLQVVPTVCHEAFGMPVLEGIACGLPQLGSHCGGIPEILEDGVDGFLFERGKLDSLLVGLRKMLSSPFLPRTAESRSNHVGKFSWNNIVSRLERYYQI
jgi:spore coat protein SA